MRYSSAVLFATSAVLVLSSPVPKPLNINMGAYSPALVVGDGAIGFKGTESVTNLMNTLQGAAANSATANGAAAPAAAAPAAAQPAAPAAEATIAQDQQGAAVTQMLEGMGKNAVTVKRDPIDEVAYRLKALDAEIETRKMTRDTADDLVDDYEDLEVNEEIEDEYKRDVEELEGEIEVEYEDVEKRDLTGFNAALNYATGALKSGPEVQLGTGEGGSGVGITQKAGGATTGNGTARVG
ncbi:hypothetical protein N431DRAFT_70914 [Stipitochalara longipes BDJ]|nr:hypothetical protein N431DRAFT_70914 [Stipitochalara longipes BDJ]